MIVARWAARLPKWLALIVGVQLLFWIGGGLFMVSTPIERVRGEHRAPEATPRAVDPAAAIDPATAVRSSGLGAVRSAALADGPRGSVWTLTPVSETPTAPVLVSALTGQVLPPLDRAEALRLATGAYAGPGRPVSAKRLAAAPEETGREGPL